jgi:hypothetical protein
MRYQLKDSKLGVLETPLIFLSDVDGMNAFFI